MNVQSCVHGTISQFYLKTDGGFASSHNSSNVNSLSIPSLGESSRDCV